MLVVSYNPGYQTLLKALKPSTRQRFVAIEFDFLPPEQEIAVVAAESGLAPDRVRPLVRLAGRLRALKGHDLEEGVSTRLIVYCATLVAAGVSVADAVLAGMIEPLTDDADVKAALVEVARAVMLRVMPCSTSSNLRRPSAAPGTAWSARTASYPVHPKHAVALAEVRSQIAVDVPRAWRARLACRSRAPGAQVRAIGSAGGSASGSATRRLDHPGRDAATVFLPDRIAIFPIARSTLRSIAGWPPGSRSQPVAVDRARPIRCGAIF